MTFNIQDFVRLGLKREVPELIQKDGMALNLGSGSFIVDGAIPLDLPEWDADVEQIPYDKESISTIHAYHFLEHLKNPVRMIVEIERVLVKGGVANIVVPYYTSNLMAQDLDHKHAFSEETFPALFRQKKWYGKNARDWELQVHANFIFGIVERNLCLFTQLVKS